MKLILENWKKFLREQEENLTEEEIQKYLAFVGIAVYKGSATNSLFYNPNEIRNDSQAFDNYHSLPAKKAFENTGVDPFDLENIRHKIFEKVRNGEKIGNYNITKKGILHKHLGDALIAFINKKGVPNKRILYSGGTFPMKGLGKENEIKQMDFGAYIFMLGSFFPDPQKIYKFFYPTGKIGEGIPKNIPKGGMLFEDQSFATYFMNYVKNYGRVNRSEKAELERIKGKMPRTRKEKIIKFIEISKAGYESGNPLEALQKFSKEEQELYFSFMGQKDFQNLDLEELGDTGFGSYKTLKEKLQEDTRKIKIFEKKVENMQNAIQNVNPDTVQSRRRLVHSFSLNLTLAKGFASDRETYTTGKREEFFPSIMIVEPGSASKTLDIITKSSNEDEVIIIGKYKTTKVELGGDGFIYQYVKFE